MAIMYSIMIVPNSSEDTLSCHWLHVYSVTHTVRTVVAPKRMVTVEQHVHTS